jgi:hypothetical protein
MTAVSDNMPGWFKRRRTSAESAPENGSGEVGGEISVNWVTASTTTGGSTNHEPVVVWEAANLMEAQVVKGRLESEGIPAFIRSEAAGVIYGIMAGSLARADVLVPGPLAEKAVEILFGIEGDEEAGDESGQGEGSVSSDNSADQASDQDP